MQKRGARGREDEVALEGELDVADGRGCEVLEDVVGVVRLEGGGEVVGERDLLLAVGAPGPAPAAIGDRDVLGPLD